MEHYRNKSLKNIVDEIDGIIYNEEWKPIIGYEGLYEISSFGRVKSLYKEKRGNNCIRKCNEFIMSATISGKGYLSIPLCKNGHSNRKLISRIVGIHYLPNPKNLPQINHKKGNKLNNHFIDLEWSTSLDNILHSISFGLRKCQKGISKKRDNGNKINRDIAEEILNLNLPQYIISEKHNVSTATVSLIKNKKIWI